MKLRISPVEREPFDHELEDGSVIVGRSSTAQLALADPYASRHHARLTRRGASLFVEDLGARNGTFVNGRRISGATEVRPGDVIKIAGSTIARLAEGAAISDVLTDAADVTMAGASTIARSAADILGESSDSLDARTGSSVLRQYARRLETLRQIHRTFSRATSRADLLRIALDWTFDLFSPQYGAIYLRASDGELRKAESRPAAHPGAPLPESMITQVVRDGLAMATQVRALQAGVDGPVSTSSLIAAPLLDPNGCLGLIVLGRDSPGLPFTQEQLDLLVELAGEAALELDKIKLLEGAEQVRSLDQQLAWARQIQLSILPAELPAVEGYSFYSRNIPSRGVSGDFYSLTFRRERQECVLFMGDVSGKGFPAAMVASSVEALSAVMIEAGNAPDEICSRLSRQLFERTPPSGYVTAFVAALDRASGRLVYTNAGHPPALLALPDGSVEQLGSFGLPLALIPGSEYSSREVILPPGATLLLYTDGVTEAADPNDDEFGVERLVDCFARHHRSALNTVFQAISSELDRFVGAAPYADDLTVLMVRRA